LTQNGNALSPASSVNSATAPGTGSIKGRVTNPSLAPLGLFGGRFDPVHRAHIAIAQAVADQLSLQEIRWIVTGDPVHKPASADAADRLAMVKLALAELGDARMQWDDREIIAAQRGQANYTADTLQSLQQEFPDRRFIWILGEDQLQDFQTWRRWEWLIQQMELAVCARPSANSFHVVQAIQSQGGTIHWIAVRPDAVSSTQIREKIRAQSLPQGLIPQSVADYIATHQLYL
jgi:nicotinate-nucleotide adenylyltransferase